MTNVKSGITEILFKIAGEKYRDIVLIALAWNSTVGVLMSQRSHIHKIEHGLLFVKVTDHVWKQEFVNLKPKILQDLKDNTKLEIKNILFI